MNQVEKGGGDEEDSRDRVGMKEKQSSKKISYVYRVPGKDLILIAGYFE